MVLCEPVVEAGIDEAARALTVCSGREAEAARNGANEGLRARPQLPVSDEGNHVAVGITDMKIRAAPSLPSLSLGEIHASLFELLEQPLHIGDLDRGQDKRDFPRRELHEVWLVDEAKVQADFVARDRTVKWRGAMKEIDLKSQLFLEKRGTRRHVSNEQDRNDGLQSYLAH